MKSRHPFHLVTPSPWPLLVSASLLLTVLSFLVSLSGASVAFFLLSFLLLLSVICYWLRNVIVEGTFLGYHSLRVQSSLTLGWIFFLCSEVLFFVSFFWAYLHYSLSPDPSLGGCWPPAGVTPVSPWSLPLLNTCLLLLSSATVTWAHSSLLCSKGRSSFLGLVWTLVLALCFLLAQVLEYLWAPFTIADSCYGSIFYMGTGFHGFHVLLGTVMLSLSLFRLLNGHFRRSRHLGLAFGIWYWHFVDVI